MLSITEPTNIALAQKLLRFECEDVLYVPRETQPRSESEKMLAFFHLLTDGCWTMALP